MLLQETTKFKNAGVQWAVARWAALPYHHLPNTADRYGLASWYLSQWYHAMYAAKHSEMMRLPNSVHGPLPPSWGGIQGTDVMLVVVCMSPLKRRL